MELGVTVGWGWIRRCRAERREEKGGSNILRRLILSEARFAATKTREIGETA